MRTTKRYTRVYIDGYDLSGYAVGLGELSVAYNEAELVALTDSVVGKLPDTPEIGFSELRGVFDPTDNGLHAISSTPATRKVMVAIGMLANPVAGNPVYHGIFEQLGYRAEEDGGALFATLSFGGWSVANTISYSRPWGVLLLEKSTKTTINSGIGIDDYGSQTTNGGYMMYQVFGGNGTATLKVQHADTNLDTSFSDLAGATSGMVDCSSPIAGIAQVSLGVTVNRYLRWQIAFGTATSVTFALSFTRNI